MQLFSPAENESQDAPWMGGAAFAAVLTCCTAPPSTVKEMMSWPFWLLVAFWVRSATSNVLFAATVNVFVPKSEQGLSRATPTFPRSSPFRVMSTMVTVIWAFVVLEIVALKAYPLNTS